MVQPIFFALSLLHCRNVITEDQPPTPAKVAKKRRERGIRDVQFKILVVKPLLRQLRSEGKGEGPQQARHFVRAHFRGYTTDAPLFGKHVGRYFWGMHAAGRTQQGVVVKDVRPRLLHCCRRLRGSFSSSAERSCQDSQATESLHTKCDCATSEVTRSHEFMRFSDK